MCLSCHLQRGQGKCPVDVGKMELVPWFVTEAPLAGGLLGQLGGLNKTGLGGNYKAETIKVLAENIDELF